MVAKTRASFYCTNVIMHGGKALVDYEKPIFCDFTMPAYENLNLS